MMTIPRNANPAGPAAEAPDITLSGGAEQAAAGSTRRARLRLDRRRGPIGGISRLLDAHGRIGQVPEQVEIGLDLAFGHEVRLGVFAAVLGESTAIGRLADEAVERPDEGDLVV